MLNRPDPDLAGIPGLGPAAPPRVYQRHALGWPAGSVRALIAFLVLGVLAALAVFSQETQLPLLYVYLQYLLVLIVAHYFAAHGSTIGSKVSSGNPLGLPRGSIRLLLLAGLIGLVAWLVYSGRELKPPQAPLVLPAVLLGGFFLGYLITQTVRLASGGELPPWFQDIQAWVALIAMIGLVAAMLVHLFINPSLEEEQRLHLPELEGILAATVGFYFGARS